MQVGFAQGQLLGRVIPSGTTPVTLFQAGELRAEITLFIISQAPLGGGATATLQIYHDDEGKTYYVTTIVLSALMTKDSPTFNPIYQAQTPSSGLMIKPGGSIGVSTTEVDETVFSVYGVTETRAEQRIKTGR